MRKDPYSIILSKHITEKSTVLGSLHTNNSNACVRKCVTPKVVFIVEKKAKKQEIADAIEAIYAKKKVKVLKVNTILMKQKKRRVRGRPGMKAGFKKAIVTLRAEDQLEDEV